ncbi:MAG: peptidase S41 [Nitrospinae bacterium CG11_big_fil_rev_8_21_14_0_20_45_15]|nr:MAG: peptidase S41 [Nitrospinae bacterium CG11_big_fil_rev_8_21_14_0_20_45_15]
MEKTFKYLPVFFLVFIGTVILSISFEIKGKSLFFSSAHAGFFDRDLELFEETVELVAEKYVYPPNFKTLFEGAIEGMVKSIDDEKLAHKKRPEFQTLTWKGRTLRFHLTYEHQENFASFVNVYNFLVDEFEGKASKSKLEQAAIRGLMDTLDPYSQFMDNEVFSRSMRDTEGKYGGLGMLITMRDKRLEVVDTMRNSPARRAGIKAGDIFVSADGKDVANIQIEELADRLRGYPDTQVKLSLKRPSDESIQEYTLTREIIEIETVRYETLDGLVGHISITSFSKQTDNQLEDAFKQAKKDKVKGFILDLRDNPGGLLTQSVKVAGHFLSPNRLVVYTRGRDKQDYSEYRAEYDNSQRNTPVVVLVSGSSASASEIVAGALRDVGKALILGETSYGKGSVQTIFRISDGAGLRLTTSKYYTPSGIDITEHGIIPDIMVETDLGKDVAEEGIPEDDIYHKKKTTLPGFPSLRLKEKDVEKIVIQSGGKLDRGHDALLGLAQMALKNINTADKKNTLEKVRELAANIIY